MASLTASKRLVVKIGSALLVDRDTGRLRADWLQDGWQYWALWNRLCAPSADFVEESETAMLEADAGRNLGFVRLVAERRETPRWR